MGMRIRALIGDFMFRRGFLAFWVVVAGACLAQNTPDVRRSPSETRRDSEWKTAEIFRKAAVRPGGRLAIVDAGPAVGGKAETREAQVGRHVMESRMVEHDLTEAGFRILELSDPFAELSNADRLWLIAVEAR